MPFSWSFSFFEKPSHVFIPLQKGLSVFPNSLQQKQKTYYMENSLLVDVVHALLYHIVEHQKYFQAIYMGHQG